MKWFLIIPLITLLVLRLQYIFHFKSNWWRCFQCKDICQYTRNCSSPWLFHPPDDPCYLPSVWCSRPVVNKPWPEGLFSVCLFLSRKFYSDTAMPTCLPVALAASTTQQRSATAAAWAKWLRKYKIPMDRPPRGLADAIVAISSFEGGGFRLHGLCMFPSCLLWCKWHYTVARLAGSGCFS